MSAPPLKLSASSSLQLGGDGQTDGASQIMGRTPKEAGSVSSRNGPVQLARTARETSGPSRSSSTGSAPPKQRPHQTPSTRIALRAATNSKSVALHVRGSGSHTTKPPPRNRQSTASLSQTSLAQTSSAEDLPPSAEMQPGGGKSGGGGLGRRGSSELTEEGAGIGSSRSFKSAAMSKLEREIEELRKENAQLKQERNDTRSLYEQLVSEGPQEVFVEKRVHLLKCQIVQLERQVVLLTSALSRRADTLLELQNLLDSLNKILSGQRRGSRDDPASSVVIPPHDLEAMADKIKTMKAKLCKCSTATSLESLGRPLLFMNSFVRPARGEGREQQPTSLLDVCHGGIEHLNLKHVSQLESRLAQLYGQLTQLLVALQATPLTAECPALFQPIDEHVAGQVTKSCRLIGQCCHDLLSLSLLVPAAPWPPLSGKEVSVVLESGSIFQKLPPSLRCKKEVKEAIESAAKSFNYSTHMQEQKCIAMECELKFHKSVYELQMSYVDSLFHAVRKGYSTFEQSAQELICQPLREILSGYEQLCDAASENTWLGFLHVFQQHTDKLRLAIKSLSMEERGEETLSQFGRHFFASLRRLEEECSQTRTDLPIATSPPS